MRSTIFKLAIAIAALAFVGISLAPTIGYVRTMLTGGPTVASGVPTSQLERQIEGYQLVLEREPNNPTALDGLASSLLQAGRLQQAIAPLETLVKRQPGNLLPALQLGELLLQTGRSEAAVALYRDQFKRYPDRPLLLDGLVSAEIAAGHKPAAIQVLEQQWQAHPDRIEIALRLGRVYQQGDRRGDALNLYDRLLAQHPDDYRALTEKAIALAETEVSPDREAALDLLQQAKQTAPQPLQAQLRQLEKRMRPAGGSTRSKNNPNSTSTSSSLPQ
jgi:tetratricopeptide (TPR) repeat protein